MKILDAYLLRRFVWTLAKTLITLLSLYILIDLLTHREAAIAKYGVSAGVVARYYLMLAPRITYQVAPLAMLVSALLVFGDAAAHNEVTAVLAGGISLWRYCRTPMLVAAAYAVCLFCMQETVGAAAMRESNRLETAYFSRVSHAPREGVSWTNLRGEGDARWTCHVRKFNRLALTGESVLIHSIGTDTMEQIEVDRIFWDPGKACWFIEDGWWRVFDIEGPASVRPRRVTQARAPFTESPTQLFALEQDTEAMTFLELGRLAEYAQERGMPAEGLRTDYHAKFSWPALNFIMIGLAIPFALRLRRGGVAISFGASIAVAMAYLVLFYTSTSLGHAGRLSPFAAAWVADFMFLGAAGVLLARTPA